MRKLLAVAKREFKELWARINRKHAYTVSFSDDELRSKSIERINGDLRVSRLQYTLTVGGQKAQATRDEATDNGLIDAFAREHEGRTAALNAAIPQRPVHTLDDVAALAKLPQRGLGLLCQ